MIAPAAPTAANPVRRLPGMRDVPAAASRRRRDVQSRLADFIGQYGYAPLDVPTLEPTELFLRKSGGALASRMYSFTDPGSNAVSLRPEFTASVMRHYLEMRHYQESTGESPDSGAACSAARWQYAGPVFRYDPDNAAASGQFTQIGAELIGADGIAADAELLALAAGAVASLGISDYRLRLADLSVLDSVLDTVGLSERARAFIIANMNRIGDPAGRANLLDRAAELRIVAGRELPPDEANLAAAVAGLPDNAARAVLSGFMQWRGAATTGQRTPDEIINRLLYKLRGGDDPDAVRRGLQLAGQLASVSGAPDAAAAQAQAVANAAGADAGAVSRLSQLVAMAAGEPTLYNHLAIDFTLARGIAYYNGIIFDLVHNGGIALGGGGRYDALARALGGRHAVPALGFACTLETLLAVMPTSL